MEATQRTYEGVGSLYCFQPVETQFIVEEIYRDQLYVLHDIELGPGDVVIDAGANVGVFSLFAAERIGPTGRVYAFEPVQTTFDVLRKNLALHNAEAMVTPLNAGLTSLDGPRQATFAVYTYGAGWSTMKQANRKAMIEGALSDPKQFTRFFRRFDWRVYYAAKMVKLLRLDPGWFISKVLGRVNQAREVQCQLTDLHTFLAERPDESIKLCKVDVEGAELDLLRGLADDDWQRIEQWVIEVQNIDDGPSQAKAILESHGCTVIADDPQVLAKDLVMEHIIYARRN